MFGLFQAPYYAFSQTMMAELTPPGFDNMVGRLLSRAYTISCTHTQFFGLFGLSNRASSMIGPNVIQAIIDDTGNNWKGFPFLFAICTAASVVIWFGEPSLASRCLTLADSTLERRGCDYWPSRCCCLGGEEPSVHRHWYPWRGRGRWRRLRQEDLVGRRGRLGYTRNVTTCYDFCAIRGHNRELENTRLVCT